MSAQAANGCNQMERCPNDLDLEVQKLKDKIEGKFGIESTLEELRHDVKSLLRLQWGFFAVPTLLGVIWAGINIVRAIHGS